MSAAPALRDSGAAEAASTTLGTILDAVPFACAAFSRPDGALVAGNTGFDAAFSGLPGHRDRAGLLLALGAVQADDGAELRAPHSGHWYALHWRRLALENGEVDLLTAVDISERLQALDTHNHQQEKT